MTYNYKKKDRILLMGVGRYDKWKVGKVVYRKEFNLNLNGTIKIVANET